jgi:hypothetical protein
MGIAREIPTGSQIIPAKEFGIFQDSCECLKVKK